MEIIRNYIENCFLPYEQNSRVLAAKAELLSAMEDKYNDLIAQGKTENEAIGTVIAEFGDISELKNELRLTETKKDFGVESLPKTDNEFEEFEEKKELKPLCLDKEGVKKYIRATKRFGRRIGFGIFMCINCVSALLFVNFIRHYELLTMPNVGVAALLLFVAIAVAVFIFSATTYECYEKYEDYNIILDARTRDYVEEKQRKSKAWFAVRIALGVALCILSPVSYLVLPDVMYLPTVILLLAIGLGVSFMSSAGISSDAYSNLLGKEENGLINVKVDLDFDLPKNTHDAKQFPLRQICNSSLWLATLIAFLVWGIVFDGWAICWIVFIISALISAIVNPILNAVEK